MSSLFGLFTASRSSPSPNSLTPETFTRVTSPSTAAALLKSVVTEKHPQMVLVKPAMEMMRKIALTSITSVQTGGGPYKEVEAIHSAGQLAAIWGELGVLGSLESLLASQISDVFIYKSILELFVFMTSETPHRVFSMNQSYSTSLTRSEILAAGVDTKYVSLNRARLSHSALLFRLLKLGQTHVLDISVSRLVIQLFHSLSSLREVVQRLISANVAHFLTHVLSLYPEGFLCQSACMTIDSLIMCDLEDWDGELGTQQKFQEQGLGSVLFTILSQPFSPVPSPMTKTAQLDSSLATELAVELSFDDSPTLLTTEDSPPKMAMPSHFSPNVKENADLDAISWVIRLIGTMARYNPELKQRLAQLNLCPSIYSVATRSPYMVQNSLFASSLCWCVANLGYPESSNQLLLTSMCDVIALVLRTHGADAEVIQEALRAIRQLVHDCEVNLTKFMELRVLETITGLFKTYSCNAEVMQWVMYTLTTFASFPAGRAVLGHSSICPEFAACLQRFLANEDLVQWTTALLIELTVDTSIVETLQSHQISLILLRGIGVHMSHPEVLEELLQCVASMISSSTKFCHICVEEGVAPLLLSVMEKHENHEAVSEQALLVFSSLLKIDSLESGSDQGKNPYLRFSIESDCWTIHHCATRKCIAQVITSPHAMVIVRMIRKALNKFSTNRSIVERGTHVLSVFAMNMLVNIASVEAIPLVRQFSILRFGRITWNSEETMIATGSSEVINVLLKVLAIHVRDRTVIHWIFLTLLQLCANVSVTQQLVVSGTFVNLLIQVVDEHSQASADLVNLACQLVAHVCVSHEGRQKFNEVFLTLHRGSPNPLLVALAHHLTSTDVIRPGTEALSALCLEPALDALGLASRLSGGLGIVASERNTSSGVVENNQESGGQEWLSFENTKLDSQTPVEASAMATSAAVAADKVAAAAGDGTRMSSIFGGWFKKSVQSSSAASLDAILGGEADLLAQHIEILMHSCATLDAVGTLQVTNNGPSSNILAGAASSLLASGMGEGPTEPNSPSAFSSIRTNADMLLQEGILAVLFSMMSQRPLQDSSHTLLGVINALNSLALTPVCRVSLNDPELLGAVVGLLKQSLAYGANGMNVAEMNTEEDSQTSSLYIRLLIASLLFFVGSVCLTMPEGDRKQHRVAVYLMSPTQAQESLESFGLSSLLFELLSTFSDDPLLVEATLRAIYYLTVDRPAISASVSEIKIPTTPTTVDKADETSTQPSISAYELLIRILRQHSTLPNVAYYNLLVMASVASLSDSASEALGAAGASELITRTMIRHEHRAPIMLASCQAIYAMRPLSRQFGKLGVCKYVISSMIRHGQSASVAEWACRAIKILAESTDNWVELDQQDVSTVLISALTRHIAAENFFSVFTRDTSSSSVAQWGCAAIHTLASFDRRQIASSPVDFQSRLLAVGAAEAIARVLTKYVEAVDVLTSACKALVSLVNGKTSADVQSRLGSLGVCSSIVEGLQMASTHIGASKWGCRLMSLLAESHEANAIRLANAGACEVVPLLLQSHPTSEAVAIAGSDVISFMTEDLHNGLAMRYGQAGACEAVVAVLRHHYASANVVARGCIALGSLARLAGNANWFGPTGAGDALQMALLRHQESSHIVKYVVGAVGNLCIVEANKERLGAIGICEGVVATMVRHMDDLECVKACAAAVWKLCESSTPSTVLTGVDSGTSVPTTISAPATRGSPPPELDSLSSSNTSIGGIVISENSLHNLTGHRNRAILAAVGICETIVNALTHHLTDSAVCRTLCRCIFVLASGPSCSNEREDFGKLGACEALGKAMQFHEQDVDVMKWTCMAVRALVVGNSMNQLRMLHSSATDAVALAISHHRTKLGGVTSAQLEAALSAMSALAVNCLPNKRRFARRCVVPLIEILETSMRTPTLLLSALHTLFHITDGCADSRRQLAFQNKAVDILLAIYGRYTDEEDIIEATLALLIILAIEPVGKSHLFAAQVPKLAISLLNKHEKTSVEPHIPLVILLVTVLSYESRACQDRFHSLGIAKQLFSIMNTTISQTSSASGLSIGMNRTSTTTALPVGTSGTILSTGSVLSSDEMVLMSSAIGKGRPSRLFGNKSELNSEGILVSDLLQVVTVHDHTSSNTSTNDRISTATTADPTPADLSITRLLTTSLFDAVCSAVHSLATGHEGNRATFCTGHSTTILDLCSAVVTGNVRILSRDITASQACARAVVDSLLSSTS